jgi:hypothetical protein
MLRPALLAAALALAVLHHAPGPPVTLVSAAFVPGMPSKALKAMDPAGYKAQKTALKAMDPAGYTAQKKAAKQLAKATDLAGYRADKLAKLADPAKMQKYLGKKALKAGMTNVRKMAKKYEKQVKLNAMSPAAQQAALQYKAGKKALKKNFKKGALAVAAAGGAMVGAAANAYLQQRNGPIGILPAGTPGVPPPNMNVVGVPPSGNIHAQSRDGQPPTNTAGPPPNTGGPPPNTAGLPPAGVNAQSVDGVTENVPSGDGVDGGNSVTPPGDNNGDGSGGSSLEGGDGVQPTEGDGGPPPENTGE